MFRLGHVVYHLFSRIDIGLVAGGYEGVNHGSAIYGVVIVAVAIVVQDDLQWAYDLLDIVVVRLSFSEKRL